MNEVAFSVIIPYWRRLANIRLAFGALAEQTLGRDEFEVVVGVLENSEEYVALCREFAGRLRIVSVLSDRPWQVGYARNLAIRQATGRVLVLLDTDMLLPPNLLRNLHERHFAYGQRVCVVGQLIDYENNTQDVTSAELRPFGHYRELLAKLDAAGPVRSDPRIDVPLVVPWSFAWTALIAVPADLVREHSLLFDLDFHGYGVEDLEWAYRLCATGTPIVMAADVYGIHLPHVRDVAANRRTETLNYRRFLDKWPNSDVELACAVGDFEANALYRDFVRALRAAVDDPRLSLAVVLGAVGGVSTLVVGAVVDDQRRLVDAETPALFDASPVPRVLPIAGLALPWEDQSVRECLVLPPVSRLKDRYRDRVMAEARRVACRVSEREA